MCKHGIIDYNITDHMNVVQSFKFTLIGPQDFKSCLRVMQYETKGEKRDKKIKRDGNGTIRYW